MLPEDLGLISGLMPSSIGRFAESFEIGLFGMMEFSLQHLMMEGVQKLAEEAERGVEEGVLLLRVSSSRLVIPFRALLDAPFLPFLS